ncbi:MAG: nickel-dependent lactate racemase [Ignavibacteriales bacterium]|nr:nickel-dependent lactate racemase [Ignavibacteriales bacterium]
MIYNIYYAGKINQIELSDKKIIPIIYPDKKITDDENSIISNSISNPLNSKSLKDFIRDENKLLIIINDGARPTPTAKILKHLNLHIKSKEVKFIIATGVHRNPSEEELKKIFGEFYFEYKSNIVFHNAKDKSENVYLGKTSRGTEVYLNKIISDYKKKIAISSVEPHYFAGYTGGRKSFVPGIASFETIEHNHKFALYENSKGLILKGNPVSEDMDEAISFLKDKEIFSIQAVLDIDRKIYSVSSGNIFDSFAKAVSNAEDVFCARAKEKADIVIAVASPPTDSDLCQAHKAIEHSKLILKDEGILILIAQCKEGLGPQGYYDLLSSCNTPEEVFEKISKGYKLGYHKAAKLAEIMMKSEIWAVTDLTKETMDKIFIKKYSEVETAIYDAIKRKGSDAKLAILNDAGNIVPIIE